MTGAGTDGTNPKPPGAWTAEQTVEYMIEKVFDEGDFYVICPDNEATSVSRHLSRYFSITCHLPFGVYEWETRSRLA